VRLARTLLTSVNVDDTVGSGELAREPARFLTADCRWTAASDIEHPGPSDAAFSFFQAGLLPSFFVLSVSSACDEGIEFFGKTAECPWTQPPGIHHGPARSVGPPPRSQHYLRNLKGECGGEGCWWVFWWVCVRGGWGMEGTGLK